MSLDPQDKITLRSQYHKKQAQSYADAFWFWAAVGSLVGWWASWAWATIPGALMVACVFFSIRATKMQTRLEIAEKEIERLDQEERQRGHEDST